MAGWPQEAEQLAWQPSLPNYLHFGLGCIDGVLDFARVFASVLASFPLYFPSPVRGSFLGPSRPTPLDTQTDQVHTSIDIYRASA
jgi:hypothetical protein